MRYQPILMLRLEDEERVLSEQIKLKERAGLISATDVTVTEKNIYDYIKQVGGVIVSGIFILLVFIGMLTVLNPSSREILLGTIGL